MADTDEPAVMDAAIAAFDRGVDEARRAMSAVRERERERERARADIESEKRMLDQRIKDFEQERCVVSNAFVLPTNFQRQRLDASFVARTFPRR